MTETELIELEMAYEPYSSQTSCLDPLIRGDGDLRECRRGRGHGGTHASGHTTNGTFTTWEG